MNKITVIGTFHTEVGACSSDELVKIIENISPNVIFCEAAPEVLQTMLKATESFNPPEIKALRKIVKNHSIDIIPVDLHNDPFDGRLEAMLELFKKKIKDHHCASLIQVGEIHRLGFPYLNGEDSDQIHKDKSSMEKIFVTKANHYQLSKTYKAWLRWNDERENHWIDVIHKNFESNKFNNAVFLVGSAHRIRLMEKIKKFQNRSELIPNWDFYPFE